MVELQTKTQNFKFMTTPQKEGEKPKEFILTYNGENLAINTKGNFISIVDFEIAKKYIKQFLKKK